MGEGKKYKRKIENRGERTADRIVRKQEEKQKRTEERIEKLKSIFMNPDETPKKTVVRIASIIGAATLIIGGYGYWEEFHKPENTKPTAVAEEQTHENTQPTAAVEEQINIPSIGLSEQTVKELDDLTQYVYNIDEENISNEEIAQKCSELSEIRLACIKEKVAETMRCSVDQIDIDWKVKEPDKWAKIIIKGDLINGEEDIIFKRGSGFINTMPKELYNIILLKNDINNTQYNIEIGAIDKEKGLKQLRKYVEKLNEFRSYDLLYIDGKLVAVIYKEQEKEVDQQTAQQTVRQTTQQTAQGAYSNQPTQKPKVLDLDER